MASDRKKVLDKKDINRLAFDSVFLQAGFNYERMQSCGFLGAQLPALKKIYKDDKEGLSAAMTDNLEFINTHPNLVGFLMGLLISMEESHADRGIIKGLKVALFAPLAYSSNLAINCFSSFGDKSPVYCKAARAVKPPL